MKHMLIVLTAAFLFAFSFAIADDGPLNVDAHDNCDEQVNLYRFDITATNSSKHDIHVDANSGTIVAPSGNTIYFNVPNGIVPAKGSVSTSVTLTLEQTEIGWYYTTITGVILETGTTVSNTSDTHVSGHCTGTAPTETPTEEPTATHTQEPTIAPTNTSTDTPTVTPTGTVTPGQTTVPTNTAIPTNTSVALTETPSYDPTVVIYPTATTIVCTEEKCLEAYCEWLSTAQAIWIRSAGDVGPLFAKVEFPGWDVFVGGYYIRYQVSVEDVIALAIPGMIITDMQCSVCPSAPLAVKVDGEWFGLYVPNLSNVSNLAVAFEAQGIETVTSILWAISIANQYNTSGNYTPGYYRVSGPIDN